jgi:hypothetical protein
LIYSSFRKPKESVSSSAYNCSSTARLTISPIDNLTSCFAVAQSVEETVKSLIDDGLVHVEKVGTVNLFWSFSSEASLATSRALTKLRTERDRLESENAELQKALQKSAADRLVNVRSPQTLPDFTDLHFFFLKKKPLLFPNSMLSALLGRTRE